MENNWKSNKEEHLKLSAAAAEKYDELYENANFATGSYMRYELETVKRFVNLAPSRNMALDLGCGTGRDSFYLARHFNQVYGYDFSPEMIFYAEKNKLHKRVGNASFQVLDIEEVELPWANNTIPFINTAFGMGSFVHNLERLYREVKRVLQPGGIAIFSFYNLDALVNKLDLQWRPALAARVVDGEECLEVNFEGNQYKIAAKAYNVNDIKKRIINSFGQGNLIEITTFPTLSALFPQELFSNETTKELCTKVDTLLASNLDIAAGPYIVAVCRKGGKQEEPETTKGYASVLNLLKSHNIDTTMKIKEHGPVKTMDDVKRVLNAEPNAMVKSILVQIKNTTNENEVSHLHKNLFLIGITEDRKLDFSKLATILDVPRKNIEMADQIQVEDITGFQVGSIPPFGLPRHIPVILDNKVKELASLWCGTGKSTESIRLTLDELKVLSTPTFNDVSKPKE